MAAIFVVSNQSQIPDLPAGLSNHTGHFLAYGGLAVAALRAFARATWIGVSGSAAIRAVLLASAYGVTDELHQLLVPNRFAGIDDWAADTIGATAGVLAILALARWRHSRRARTRGV